MTINDVISLSSQGISRALSTGDVSNGFSAVIVPSVTYSYFTLYLQGKLNATVSLNIIDASGKLMQAWKGVTGSLQFGSNYLPGVYYAEVIQGNQKITLKLIKH